MKGEDLESHKGIKHYLKEFGIKRLGKKEVSTVLELLGEGFEEKIEAHKEKSIMAN